MVSLAYPNVNRHIYPVPTYTLPYQMTNEVPNQSTQLDQVIEDTEDKVASRGRLSAPPPYSEEDTSFTSNNNASITSKKASPSLLLEVALGYKLAKNLTEMRQKRKEVRLQKVHDAWMKLGINTRLIASQGGELPPHFWNPPNYGPEEMNARLTRMGI